MDYSIEDFEKDLNDFLGRGAVVREPISIGAEYCEIPAVKLVTLDPLETEDIVLRVSKKLMPSLGILELE